MGHSIFDWDDDGDKRETGRQEQFLPRSGFAHSQPERPPEYPTGNDPWEQPAREGEWQPPDNQWQEPVTSWSQGQPAEEEPIEYIPYQPESADETIRRGGLAWSAGIVFFSSIVFMLFVGWVVDWIFQSSPWGIVGGIVLGSILGFVQFFRISSQIFDSKKAESAIHPLMPRDDDDRYN